MCAAVGGWGHGRTSPHQRYRRPRHTGMPDASGPGMPRDSVEESCKRVIIDWSAEWRRLDQGATSPSRWMRIRRCSPGSPRSRHLRWPHCVGLRPGTSSAFRLIGTDPLSDLAVVRVDGPIPLPAELGEASRLRVGQPVVAVATPLGSAGTVTAGVVSALGRSMPARSGDTVRIVEDVIQTDAALNPATPVAPGRRRRPGGRDQHHGSRDRGGPGRADQRHDTADHRHADQPRAGAASLPLAGRLPCTTAPDARAAPGSHGGAPRGRGRPERPGCAGGPVHR